MNIIHIIHRVGWNEIFPFLLLQTVSPPIIQFNPQPGGQINDIYLLYCYGGEARGQTTTQSMQFYHFEKICIRENTEHPSPHWMLLMITDN